MIYSNALSVSLSVSTRRFIDEIIPELKADPAFQASDETRWDEEQQSDFMNSVVLNMAPSKFIFADVHQCLQSAEDEERVVDIKYFRYWAELGVRWLNLDSNNRSINLLAFFNNKIAMPPGDYDLDGKLVKIVKDMNDTFDTLPEFMKEFFEDQTITLEIYTKATREQLSQIFEKVNEGKPLNAPEKRNASTSTIARVIRELAKECKGFLADSKSKWFKNNELIRRGLDDFIAGCAFIFFEGVDSACPSRSAKLKEMYSITSTASEKSHRFRKDFKGFMSWIDASIYACPNKNSLLDLYTIWRHIQDNNMQLKDGVSKKDFFKEYIKVVGDLLGKETFYTRTEYGGPKDDQITFKGMLGGRQYYNNCFRKDLILSKIKLDKFFVKLDKKRTISREERLQVAARDNFKTPEGKEITLEDLQTGKYHAGHIKAHVRGGKTSPENNVIQEAEDNLKNSSNDLEITLDND
tara:strand:- start:359 stop:1756 length:1398 start_codon:yes stop_codon:yes gene_type:complete